MAGWLAPPFEKLCGMRILEACEGTAKLRMEFRVKLSTGAGLMHGGALAALADTAVAMAIKSLLPEGSHFVTKQFSCTFLAPVRKGAATANARVVSQEGDELATEAIVTDDEGREVLKLYSPLQGASTRALTAA